MSKLILSRSFAPLTFTVFAILGCATTSHQESGFDKRLTPPSAAFLAKWKEASKAELQNLAVNAHQENIQWWKTYRLGTCEGFKSLSQSMSFPLHDLALLRAYEVCASSEDLAELPANISPWYRHLAADIKLKRSAESEDLRDDFTALLSKARLETDKKSKEEFYLKALEVARKISLDSDLSSTEEALYKNSPRLNPAPEEKDLAAVAMDYRFHRQFDPAIETYKKILTNAKSTNEEKYLAQKNLRQTYKVAQRRAEYINASADLVNLAKEQFQANKKDRKSIARFHDAQVLLARTLWTEDQTSQAIKTLKETHRRLRGVYPMDEVFFILGRIEEEKGHFKKAIEYYEASYAQPTSSIDLKDKLTWSKAWNYFKLKDFGAAAESFEQMKNAAKETSDKSRARFWLARAYKTLGSKDKHDLELNQLLQEDPLGYYGMLAYRELGRPLPPLASKHEKAKALSVLTIKELDQQLRLNIEWLIAVDEKPFAERAINQAVDELNKKQITDEDTWLTVASGYARAGLYLPLFTAIGSLQPKVKDQLLNDHPDLLFPRPFSDIIQGAANEAGIPQEFIYSIIRQESAFNPQARSPVDAFGLMQLLPSVAKQLASRHKVQYQEALDLFKPEVNVPLGAFELKSLMKKYNEKFILAVSGYNANDSAIRGWLKTRYRSDAVEFIEEVPYEETRSYIKLTMRNYVFYQRLLSDGQSSRFPEELLKL